MDGAWLGSADISIKKAKTAMFFQMNTESIGELSQPGGPLFNIEHSNQGLITFPGGVPIRSAYSTLVSSNLIPYLRSKDGVIIGGVGISGSTVENDKIVAEAAVA